MTKPRRNLAVNSQRVNPWSTNMVLVPVCSWFETRGLISSFLYLGSQEVRERSSRHKIEWKTELGCHFK